jgi:transportin-1
MDWSPDTDTISQVLHMLQALRDPTCSNHQEALQTLSTDTVNPTFVLHLVHIFSRGGNYEGIPTDIRQLAGLITKNYVFPRLIELSGDVFSLVKLEIINGLADPLLTIRNTAGLLVGRITAGFMMSYWVDIMETLLGGAIQLPADLTELQSEDSPDAARIDGSLQAIKRICEDSAEKLFMDTDNRPLEALIPQLIAAFSSPVPSHRLKAIESINALIYLIPSSGSSLAGTPCALVAYMSTFLASLSQMAADPNASIRRAVCQALVLLTSFQVAVLVPMLAEVCQFMLQNISDQVIHQYTFYYSCRDTDTLMCPPPPDYGSCHVMSCDVMSCRVAG